MSTDSLCKDIFRSFASFQLIESHTCFVCVSSSVVGFLNTYKDHVPRATRVPRGRAMGGGWLQLGALLLLLMEVRHAHCGGGSKRRTEYEEDLMKRFQMWEKNYKLVAGYQRSPATAKHRFAVWKENLRYIQEYNQYESGHTGIMCMYLCMLLSVLTSSSATTCCAVKMNQFGDLTNKEFQKLYTSLRWYNHSVTAATLDLNGDSKTTIRWGQDKARAGKLPKSVDWREKRVVGPVKEISHCASGTFCILVSSLLIHGIGWADSVLGSLEGIFNITKKVRSLRGCTHAGFVTIVY